jgi:hypothetical protein
MCAKKGNYFGKNWKAISRNRLYWLFNEAFNAPQLWLVKLALGQSLKKNKQGGKKPFPFFAANAL